MTVAEIRRNPFPGLRPFEENEEYLFFGRETQIDDVLGRLRRGRFITVSGLSGSGKSSLMRAGMLPALHGGFMAGAGSRWRVADMRPGGEPIANLARALSACGIPNLESGSLVLRAGLSRAVLERGALGLVELVQQARLEPDENLLVLVDQFEEIFRFRPGRATIDADNEAAAFAKLLLLAASHRKLPIYVVLTMRSDYLGDCARFEDLPEAINDGLFLIPRMKREQLRQAIEGPIGVAGGQIAPRLVNRLLNDLGEDPDELPALQHALMRTWDIWEGDHEPGEPIDLRHYEATGGLHEALSRHGDEIYKALPTDRSREVAEKLFKCLTDRGSDNRGLRRPTRFDDVCTMIGASPEELRAVVDVFRAPGCSFLMPPPGTPIEENTVLDISHESLMRIWKQLQRWVDEEAQSAQMYRRLADAAALHKDGRAALWRDPDLSLATKWREQNHPDITWAERIAPGFNDAMAFLNASLRQKVQRRVLAFGLSGATLAALLAFGGYALYTTTWAFHLHEYPLPWGSSPEGIVSGPDGALWFTEFRSNQIGRITRDGEKITPYALASNSDPYGITTGPDGALWFTEAGDSAIGRIASGKISRPYPLASGSQPEGIALGSDGALWFTEFLSDKIGRITASGSVTPYPLPKGSEPDEIVSGPDGALWFTESGSDRIGHITTGGKLLHPYQLASGSQPEGITLGPDGALWFTEFAGLKIGRITTSGSLKEYPLASNSDPYGITTGPDGALWFTEYGTDKIGRITTSWQLTEFALPSGSQPEGIDAGPDGAIWFVESGSNQIGRLARGL